MMEIRDTAPTTKRVVLLGVPMDLGGGRRGVDMGPSAVRIACLEEKARALGLDFEDRGNVPVSQPESRKPRNPKARFQNEIRHCCTRLRARVERILDQDEFPLIVGGDHSIAMGTVAGVSSWFHARDQQVGLLWFDAHGDMNTPDTTTSGNIHGMPLAVCLGRGIPSLVELGSRVPMVDPARTVLVGLRDVDAHERVMIQGSGITVFTMREIDMMGIHRVMEAALEVVTQGTAGFHLSFDVDGTDPVLAPGVGTPVRGGTNWRESHLIMELVADSGSLTSLEMTEINPILDMGNKTAENAVDLILSALGKRIL